jgi:hypothetical protein
MASLPDGVYFANPKIVNTGTIGEEWSRVGGIVIDEYITIANRTTFDNMETLFAVAAIALGLNKEQAIIFRKYAAVRTGFQPYANKYEKLIELAYDIKTGQIV